MRLSLVVATTLASVAHAQDEKRHTVRRHTGEIELDGCPAHVRWKDSPFPNALEPDRPSYVYWLHSLFSAPEAKELVQTLERASFSTAADSTDLQPAHEIYLLGNTDGAHPDHRARIEKARSIVVPRFEQCVTPFVRRKFGCPKCVPCRSLIRRYRPHERTNVVPHRDTQADVTVVVELLPANPTQQGGSLYIQRSGEDEPNMVPLRPGDAFLHDYSLLHGVRLPCRAGEEGRCTRYSLVMWFREDEAQCRTGGDVDAATRMYRRSADAGVAEGRYVWARQAVQINFDGAYEQQLLPENATEAERGQVVEEALQMLAAAVEQGHGNAAVRLAELNLMGVPPTLPASAAAAGLWRRRAAEMGAPQLEAWEALREAELAEGGGAAAAAGDGSGESTRRPTLLAAIAAPDAAGWLVSAAIAAGLAMLCRALPRGGTASNGSKKKKT